MDEQPTATRFEAMAEFFTTYSMADGSEIYGEYSFVTETDGWFDDRDEEIRLIKRTYLLVSEEEVVLPDPYRIEEEDDPFKPVRACAVCRSQDVFYDPADGWSCRSCHRTDADA